MRKHASIQSANSVETTEEEATSPTGRSSHNRQRIAAQIVQALRAADFECDTAASSLHPFNRRVGEG